jgi:cytochrome P450
MFPAFGNFRRTATTDTEIHGQPIAEGDKVLMWYVSSNRDEAVTQFLNQLKTLPVTLT